MTMFHAAIELRGRGPGGGRHSCAHDAAYRAGTRIEDVYRGKTHDYSSHKSPLHVELTGWSVRPGETHQQAQQRLCTAVDRTERRPDAVTHAEFIIALPALLTPEQCREVMRDIALELRSRYGGAVDWSIDPPAAVKPGEVVPPDSRNYHGHAGMTVRAVDDDGQWALKKDPRLTNRRLRQWARPMIAEVINRHLTMHGHSLRVDHRRLDVQYAERNERRKAADLPLLRTPTPTLHLGRTATRAMRRGEHSTIADRNDEIREANGHVHRHNHQAMRAGFEILSQRLSQRVGEGFGHTAQHRLAERVHTYPTDCERAHRSMESTQPDRPLQTSAPETVADAPSEQHLAPPSALERYRTATATYEAMRAEFFAAMGQAKKLHSRLATDDASRRTWTTQIGIADGALETLGVEHSAAWRSESRDPQRWEKLVELLGDEAREIRNRLREPSRLDAIRWSLPGGEQDRFSLESRGKALRTACEALRRAWDARATVLAPAARQRLQADLAVADAKFSGLEEELAAAKLELANLEKEVSHDKDRKNPGRDISL